MWSMLLTIGAMYALCCLFFPPWLGLGFSLNGVNSICQVDASRCTTKPSLCYCGLFLGKND